MASTRRCCRPAAYPRRCRRRPTGRCCRRASRPETLPRFDPDVEAAVYFCCLEAIQNAGKHAGAGAHVTVSVDYVDGELRFAVRDDGAGFDPVAAGDGHGFTNMADRLGAFGGTLHVDSELDSGTTVEGRIPAA